MKYMKNQQPLMSCLLMTLVMTSSVSAAKKDKPARWVPKDALLYVGTANCESATESFKKTAAFRMTEDPAVGDALQPYRKLFENAKAVLAEKLGLTSPKDIEVYPTGGAVFYMTASMAEESGEPKPHLAIVMNMGDNHDKAKTLMESVVDAGLRNGGAKETQEIAGKTITVVRFKKEDELESFEKKYAESQALVEKLFEGVDLPDSVRTPVGQVLAVLEPPEEYAFAFHKSVLIVASDMETASDALRRLGKKSSDTLASSDAMRLLKRKAEKKDDVHLIVNIPAILEMVAKSGEEASRRISALGANAIGPLVGSLDFAPSSKIDTRMRGFLQIKKGERTGLASLFLLENTPTKPPATVPANVLGYASINLDFAKVFKEVKSIVGRLDRQQLENMNRGMKFNSPDGKTIDIEKDIINHLSGPLVFMISADKPYAEKDFQSYLGLGHKSREAVNKIMTDVIPQGMMMPTDVLGHTVYDSMLPPGWSVAVTDKMMLIGSRTAAENYIRGEGKSDSGLARDPTFKSVSKHVPKKTCGVIYQDQRRLMDAQAAIAKSGDLSVGSQFPTRWDPGYLMRWTIGSSANPTLLEHAEVLRKYQTVQLVTMSTESDGLRFDGVGVLHEE